MNKKKLFIILGVIVGIIAILIGSYFIMLKPVSTKDELVTFVVNKGDSKNVVVDNLKEAKLIKNKYATLVYIVLSGSKNLQAGTYELTRNMSTQEIINSLANGEVVMVKKPTVKVLFKEGLTIKNYMELLAENTTLEYDTIIKEINSKDFLKPLINDYWFLTDDILDEKIYYALEGYLFPETYEFYEDTTLNQAVRRMLDITNKKLTEIKDQIENSEYSIHEILTIASICEKEAKTYEDRTGVAQVINTRIAKNMSLGMDVTSYYGVGKELSENNITSKELEDNNPYNTRVVTFLGLPVGPICNPGISSIKAALNPSDTNYIYFYADINTGRLHFTDNYEEFKGFKKIYG